MKQKPGWTTVFNLSTGEYGPTYSLLPDMAVMCAHAQAHGDLSTWLYEERYGHMIERTKEVVACGDFSAVRRGDTHIIRIREARKCSNTSGPGAPRRTHVQVNRVRPQASPTG